MRALDGDSSASVGDSQDEKMNVVGLQDPSQAWVGSYDSDKYLYSSYESLSPSHYESNRVISV